VKLQHSSGTMHFLQLTVLSVPFVLVLAAVVAAVAVLGRCWFRGRRRG
jgi:hypothetical protein